MEDPYRVGLGLLFLLFIFFLIFLIHWMTSVTITLKSKTYFPSRPLFWAPDLCMIPSVPIVFTQMSHRHLKLNTPANELKILCVYQMFFLWQCHLSIKRPLIAHFSITQFTHLFISTYLGSPWPFLLSNLPYPMHPFSLTLAPKQQQCLPEQL